MSIITNYTTDINTGVNPGFNPIPYYSPQLAPSGIYASHLYLFLIQPKIGNLGASTQIAPFTNNAITHIVVVGDFTTSHNYGILNLHRAANVAIIPNRGGRANITVGAKDTILADYRWANDIGT